MKLPLPHAAIVVLLILFGFQCVVAQNQKRTDSIHTAILRYKKKQAQRPADLRDTVLVSMYHSLAVEFSGNDLKQAMLFANNELSLSKQINFKKGIASGYNTLGTIYESKAAFADAIKYYNEALKISKAIGDKITEASANGNIGNVYGNQSNFNEAIKFMLRSLALAKEINDKFLIAGAYNNIGVLYMQQNNSVQALKNYHGCLQAMEEVGNQSAIAVTCNNIGQVYALQGKPDLAIKYLKKGLSAAISANDKASMANNYSGLGHVYTETKNYSEALYFYIEALRLSEEYGDSKGTARSNLTIARTYYLMNDYKKALAYANKGKLILQSSADPELLKNLYEIQSKIYAAGNNYKQAFESHVKFKDLTDSLFTKESSENFERLKLKYDLESAQDSIAAIQLKKDIVAKAEIKSQHETRNFIYIVLGLLVVFLIILLWQRNKIALIKRQKALEEERNRISRDLHDNLGSQLSTVRMFVSSLKNGASGEGISEKVDSSIGLLDASIGELRGIMNDMQSSVLLEQGYLAATEILINKVNQLHGVQFSLTHHKMEQRLPTETEHQLYRITQELINNTLKYASAQTVSLDLIRRDGKLIVMYEDDGLGYDPNQIKKGNGLRNIETRVQSIGGTVEFDSMPGNGARTNIEIPLNL